MLLRVVSENNQGQRSKGKTVIMTKKQFSVTTLIFT